MECSKNREVENNIDDLKSVEEFFLSFCDCFWENIGEFVSYIYGSYVFRIVFEVLGGVKVVDNVVCSWVLWWSREKSY